MKIIKEHFENEYIIEKSRFIANAYRINSLEEADNIIAATRKKYWDANHNCIGLSINDNQIMRSSDDKEPAGTAGIPILEVLKKNNITNTLIIVTRYFGGIKLGTGGLLRAYGKAASLVIEKAKFVEKRTLNEYKIILSYSETNSSLSLIKENTCTFSINYQDVVEITFSITSITNFKPFLENRLNRKIEFIFIKSFTDYFDLS